ncbi:MAG: isoprenylcysteine carboxylmethyltransferase family protein [Ardenticatenales bacterium]
MPTPTPMPTSPSTYAPLVAFGLGWFAFAAVFAFRKRPPAADSPTRARDRSSWWGIGLQAASFALVWSKPSQRPFGMPFGGLSILGGWPLTALVAILMALSVGLVMRAVARLGKQWAFAAQVVEDHALITDGPYAIVRNPIYTGMVGMFVASGLAIGRPLQLVLGLALMSAGTYVRIKAEERVLREAFGAEYDAYAARVPAVVPGWGRR